MFDRVTFILNIFKLLRLTKRSLVRKPRETRKFMSPKSEILDGPPCDLEITPSVNFFNQPICNTSVLDANMASSSINYAQATNITKNLSREQQQMHLIFEALMNFTDSEDRVLSEIFFKLPLKAVIFLGKF